MSTRVLDEDTMSIRPLPEQVVAQIKSSTAIVSLGGVVLELLKNSLDAKATRIVVNVDFARGGCVVEDDGLGIQPAEFSEDGGLGKRYWTSKFHPEQPHLGQHGTFLASLSAVSLLTITSSHHAYRSHNSISFHHAHTIERQTPAPPYNQIQGQHGTRITVRNLFGNMPVRIKQRAMVVGEKAEQDRLRNSLKRHATGLLLSWQGLVNLKICDSEGNTIVHVNTSNTAVTGGGRSLATEGRRSAHLSSLLQIMTQANFVTINDWPSWVPASASTPMISVKGAISLEPAPTKHIQFISIGQRPLLSECGGNELYDQVNRLFALSSFGTIEDDADAGEEEKVRRLSDKRFKSDGYTNRQLKARKGVDRHPMFHLRVTFRDQVLEGAFIEDESNLQAVIDVLTAMTVQWLSVHHFRPRKMQHISNRSRTASPIPEGQLESRSTPSRKRRDLSGSPRINETPSSAASFIRVTSKRGIARSSPSNLPGRSRSQAFADWSRIKSGKSSFFDTASPTQSTTTPEACQAIDGSATFRECDSAPRDDSSQKNAASNVAPIVKGAMGGTAMIPPSEAESENPLSADEKDETVIWTDPSTKNTHLLNARTGCILPRRHPRSGSAALSPSTARLNMRRSLRIGTKAATAEPSKTAWLNNMLETWDNPVFKTSEQGIQQMMLQDCEKKDGTQKPQHDHLRCSRFDIQKAFDDAGSASTKLSKDALRRAEVIRQVDKKFILVRMKGLAAESNVQSSVDTLVLIDQHAADERVQVESLLHELCSPMHGNEQEGSQSKPLTDSPVAQVTLDKPLHFAISSHERTHFETFTLDFAAWSILYNVSSSVSLQHRTSASKSTCKLSVTALPPSISERCKADPELLISFLRSALWKYVESPPLPPVAIDESTSSWVKKIATCPPGLVDMINSRACRSAIMFNDELSFEDCNALVSNLASCVFPFMCAHGRPSMVPIVDMGKIEGGIHSEGDSDGVSFVDAWKSWKRS